MSSINLDELVKTLETGAENLAKETLHDFVNEAKTDGKKAIGSIKTNLLNWTEDVENGAMSTADVEFLLQEEEGLDEMTALKQAGLAAVHIDQFRNGLINMIISTITGLVKI